MMTSSVTGRDGGRDSSDFVLHVHRKLGDEDGWLAELVVEVQYFRDGRTDDQISSDLGRQRKRAREELEMDGQATGLPKRMPHEGTKAVVGWISAWFGGCCVCRVPGRRLDMRCREDLRGY
jgi:hypothetical protein